MAATLWQYPIIGATVIVALFDNVTNAKDLRARIIGASTMTGPEGDAERTAVNFAFIDASLVASELHLQTAVVHALLADARSALRTKTVHSELLWALNPTNNISEAIRRFGVADTTTRLLVVRVSPIAEEVSVDSVQTSMRAVVIGDMVDMKRMTEFINWALLKKYYKLPTGISQECLHDIITSIVATKAAA